MSAPSPSAVSAVPSDGVTAGLRQPAVLAWLRLARVFAQLERRAGEDLREVGLSCGQFDVIAHVGAARGITQQQLARALLVSKGNVCQLVDKLEAAGLLERRTAGRANRLYLTERGEAVFAAAVPRHERFMARQLAAALDAAEQRTLLELLRRLDRTLQRGR